MSKEEISQNLQTNIKLVLSSWQKIQQQLDRFREEISHEYFKKYPIRMELFKNCETSGLKDSEDNLRKKLYKHSVAVINCLEEIVNFINGNEESKPILFVLGKQHKRINVSEKMFLEMKDTIRDIIKKSLDSSSSKSWEIVIGYIYVNYVFPGMYMYAKEPCVQFYSVFAPDFKNPILNEEEINRIVKTRPENEILGTRIKPALNSFTVSAFYHPDVEKFTNCIMRKGKKELAQKSVADVFSKVKHIQLRKYNNESDEEKKKNILLNPIDVFLLAVKNVTPLMWYLKIKKSGTWYKVPVGISELSARRRAMKWIIEAVKERSSVFTFEIEMAKELVAASNYQGRAVAKKIELHKMCEGNRGYLQYWWT